jgi:two-component system alkaline phosphatase synthesis response regulator PhoP
MGKEKVKILIVDDEQDIIDFISYNLKKEGYSTIFAVNGKDAIKKAKVHLPDLILMDIMMPELDGIQACREIKEIKKLKNTPVVFLTARNEEYTELAGFNAGADDFITKPLKPRILTSRIKAILKRNEPKEEISELLKFNNLLINKEKHEVIYNGELKKFPKKEFDLLFLLASKPGKVFPRDQILEKVWGNEVMVVDRTIDVHIRKIREKLEDSFITTIKGVGYKFQIEQ